MPKNTDTKTVLLSGGMGDDVDDFLLEPPSMERVENGYFDKQGTISKRRGHEALPDSGLNTTDDGPPSFLVSNGSNLVTITDKEVVAYDGDSWRRSPFRSQLGSLTKLEEARRGRGLHAGSFYETDEYRVFAYSVEDRVTIEVKALDGTFVREIRLADNTFHPIIAVEGQLIYILYAERVGFALRYKFTGYSITTGNVQSGFPTDDADALGIDALSTYAFSMMQITSRPYGLSYDPSPGLGTIATAATNSTGEIVIRRYNTFGVKTLEFETGKQGMVLDVHQHTDGTTLFLSRTGQQIFLGKVVEIGGTPILSFYNPIGALTDPSGEPPGGPQGDVEDPVPNSPAGSVTVNGNEIGVVYGDYIPTEPTGTTPFPYGTTGWTCRTFFKRFNLGTGGAFGGVQILPNYKVTSKLVPGDKSGEFFGCVQQFANIEPRVRPIIPDTFYEADRGMLVSNLYFGVSQVLCRFTENEVSPVANIDTQQSRVTDLFGSLRSTNLLSLQKKDGKYLILNRRRYDKESASLYVGRPNASIGAVFAPQVSRRIIARDEAAHTLYSFEPGNLSSAPVRVVGEGVFIGAAMPLWFDGKRVSEVTPLDTPQILSVQGQYRVDFSTPPGAYQPAPIHFGAEPIPTKYPGFVPPFRTDELVDNPEGVWRRIQIVVGFHDANGDAHRSAPSPSLFVTGVEGLRGYDAGSGSPQPFDLDKHLSGLTFTQPLAISQGVDYFVEVYLSDSVSSEPKFLASRGFDPREPGDNSISFSTLSGIPNSQAKPPTEQAALDTKFIYSAGNVLEAIPWPTVSDITSTSRRVWATSVETTGVVLYSKLFEEGVAPEFSGSLTIPLGGERVLTALERLDDKVIVFERDNIHVIFGEGPDNTGRGTDFRVQDLTTDVGTEDRKSVVETPAGLVFRSRRGFYLLDRSLNVKFIGGPVEDFLVNTVVTSAVVVPEHAHVVFALIPGSRANAQRAFGPATSPLATVEPPSRPRFTTGGLDIPLKFPAVVWNYEQDKWSYFTNMISTDAVLYQGKYTQLKPTWDIWQESEDSWLDPLGTYTLKLVTPYLKVRNVQDFARLRKVNLLGRYLSAFRETSPGVLEAGDVQVTLRKDYEPTDMTVVRFRANKDFQLEERTGGDLRAERFQMALRPKTQKIQSIQVEIKEVPTTKIDQNEPEYSYGRGFEISAVDLEIALLPGTAKTLSSRRKH